ncbi:MAG TPA: alanine racemase [Solirubrobacterales bacterium]|nr:alanine racemase [Solirubrobacterales bacterium]
MSVWEETVMAAAPGAFDRREGHLYVEECPVEELAERYGTPLHVISETALRERAREFQSAFGDAWSHGPVTLLPAVKANYAVALHRILAQEGCGADLFGPGELEVAVRAGVPPQLISLNGTAKDAATIGRAVELGARITIDSVREVELAREAARACGRSAEVRVRVRPLVSTEAGSEPYGGMPMREAFGRYKPGIPWQDLEAAGEALQAPELDLSGVHMHFGRHTIDLDEFGHVIDRYAEAIAELRSLWEGWEPRTIDIGGGIAHYADPHGRAGVTTPPERDYPTLAQYADALCGRLAAGLERVGIDPAGRALEIEPGRSLFGPVGVHLSRVISSKRQECPFPHAWMEVDTSQTHLPDIALERCRYPIAVDCEDPDEPQQPYDVVGVNCSSDVLAHGEYLPALAPGTLVAFGLTGAYQDAGATNFNVLPRAATVLVHGAESDVIKARETIDEVLARDVVPAHLQDAASGVPA